ncbi:MAG TPA: hypothetical protein VIY73_10940 [Polyangiaceae bacterium]
MRPVCVVVCGVVALGIACHDGPAANVPAASARVDQLARTCAKVASCAHAHDAAREHDPGACVDSWVGRAANEVEAFGGCVAGARDCEAVRACVRGGVDSRAAAYCGAHRDARTECDGNRLVTCSSDDPNESTAIDCASFGATCGDSKQSGGLLARACLSPSLCPPGSPEVRCEGDRAMIGCHDGAVERTACSPGARCEEHRGVEGTGSVLCETSGHRHCDAVGARWCEHDALVTCQAHGPTGEAIVTDCAASGLTCDDHLENGAACVVAAPRACDRGPTRCDGDALTFCAAGARVRISCRDLGFATCDPDAHGVDAACAASAAHP